MFASLSVIAGDARGVRMTLKPANHSGEGVKKRNFTVKPSTSSAYEGRHAGSSGASSPVPSSEGTLNFVISAQVRNGLVIAVFSLLKGLLALMILSPCIWEQNLLFVYQKDTLGSGSGTTFNMDVQLSKYRLFTLVFELAS